MNMTRSMNNHASRFKMAHSEEYIHQQLDEFVSTFDLVCKSKEMMGLIIRDSLIFMP